MPNFGKRYVRSASLEIARVGGLIPIANLTAPTSALLFHISPKANHLNDVPSQSGSLAEIDGQLVALLVQRLGIARLQANRIDAEDPGSKAEQPGNLSNPTVGAVGYPDPVGIHREILQTIQSASLPDALPEEAVAQWLLHASSLCQLPQGLARVAYLGPPFSYSYLATVRYFGQAVPLFPVQSIESVFAAVAEGDCRAGVVPIENSTDGRIVDTLSMFVKYRLPICGEVLLPIHHNLLALVPREQVTRVCSKPQALSQCRRWLARHLPTAELVEVSSSTDAARLASVEPGTAAVASREAGQQYALQVVDANIEDNPHNVTRFAILGRWNQTGQTDCGTDRDATNRNLLGTRAQRTGNDKTTLLLQLQHESGALAGAMLVFKECGLNLTWIESFPMPGGRSEYLFFVECEGHREDPTVAKAIELLAGKTLSTEVLGSYPRALLQL